MDGPCQVRHTAALAVRSASWLWEQAARAGTVLDGLLRLRSYEFVRTHELSLLPSVITVSSWRTNSYVRKLAQPPASDCLRTIP